MSSKKDLTDWGPISGQLELDLDGDATAWDKHSGQHGDVFVIFDGKASRDFAMRCRQGCACAGGLGYCDGDEVDQDEFVDYIHGKDKGSAA